MEAIPVGCRSYVGEDKGAFAEIYHDSINISIWKRKLSCHVQESAKRVTEKRADLAILSAVNASGVVPFLQSELDLGDSVSPLCQDVSLLVDMFCCLFDVDKVGLRFQVLKGAMCPRFHVDNVLCRMVTTYHGESTQWLPDHHVDRTKLGEGSKGLSDDASMIYQKPGHIEQLDVGSVALLKGERWANNQGGGLVHRSPRQKGDQKRLLLTLDLVES